jgi:hypothetical protein
VSAVTIALPDALTWHAAKNRPERTWARCLGLMLVVDEVEGEARFGEPDRYYTGWVAEDTGSLALPSLPLHGASVKAAPTRAVAEQQLWVLVRSILVHALDDLALSAVQR